MDLIQWCLLCACVVTVKGDVYHALRQDFRGPYIPPGAGSLHSKDEYLPPVEYLPVLPAYQAIRPTGRSASSLANQQQLITAHQDCCQNQISADADVPVELPKKEPEGYDYPKPIKSFDLPSNSLVGPARTLDQELPFTEDNEPFVPTTETVEVKETTLPPVSDKYEGDSSRPSRSPQGSRKSQKLLTAGEPIHIQTLPFRLNQSTHYHTRRSETQTKIRRSAQPPFGVQISPPGPSNNGRARPFNQVQISPPRPSNNVQARPFGPVQISPPRPSNNVQARPFGPVQISPPGPSNYGRTRPFNQVQISPPGPPNQQLRPNNGRPVVQISPPRPTRPGF